MVLRALTVTILALIASGSAGAAAPPDRILFERGELYGGAVYLVTVAGGPARRLVRTARYGERDARWSPDGRRIAFVHRGDIYLSNLRGAVRRLTRGCRCSAPAWSPDGRELAVARRGIVLVDAGTGRRRRLTSLAAARITWSPDGGRLAFEHRSTGAAEVWTIGRDGLAPTRLSRGFSWPSWSPDSRQVVFVDANAIVVANADGSGKRNLTDPASPDVVAYPVWSPRGDLIAYIRELAASAGGENVLDVIHADGTGHRVVSRNAAQCCWPASWSPDGRRLAFVRGAGIDRLGIYVVSADGTGLRRLTRTYSEDSEEQDPQWRP